VSAIEWTDATWNPVTGCSKVSPGCAHCYAETLSLRFGWSKVPWTPENAPVNVVLHPERLDKPKTWRTPRMVFVNSMSDLFHELVSDDYIGRVFHTMSVCPQHTFQVSARSSSATRRLDSIRGRLHDVPNRPWIPSPATEAGVARQAVGRPDAEVGRSTGTSTRWPQTLGPIFLATRRLARRVKADTARTAIERARSSAPSLLSEAQVRLPSSTREVYILVDLAITKLRDELADRMLADASAEIAGSSTFTA
jgi:hypothetical protein